MLEAENAGVICVPGKHSDTSGIRINDLFKTQLDIFVFPNSNDFLQLAWTFNSQVKG